MNKILFLVIATFTVSCSQRILKIGEEPFSSIEIETLSANNLRIRAILVENDKVWFAADKGKYGWHHLSSNEKFIDSVSNKLNKVEFRSIASNSNSIFLLNVGTPALLYKIDKSSLKKEVVYTENEKNTFYDSMNFWNDSEGIAIGDPTENCFSIITTKDGGKTWKKHPCENLPKLAEGEAAFAASNTNLIVNQNDTWIVSGGKKARIFYSPDKGKSWEVYNTPIVQGGAMTGIFSGDFYDSKTGFIVGGDFENKEKNSQNKAITEDGGKTWNLVGENAGFGYADCVQFVPDSKAEQLVTVGHSGIYYSSNKGKTWKQLSSEKGFYTLRFINQSEAIAAGKGKIVRIKFKK